jgi:hypothetical protein
MTHPRLHATLGGGAMEFDEEALMAASVSEESVVGRTGNNRWP